MGHANRRGGNTVSTAAMARKTKSPSGWPEGLSDAPQTGYLPLTSSVVAGSFTATLACGSSADLATVT